MKDPSIEDQGENGLFSRAGRYRRLLTQTTVLVVLLSVLLFQLALSSSSSRTSYIWSNLKNIHRPLQYHGQDIHSNFFEGWYFKIVKPGLTSDDPTHGIALIPGIYRPPPPPPPLTHTQFSNEDDKVDDRAHAFVIVLGLPGKEKSAYYRFPVEEFKDLVTHQEPGQEGAFRVQIGASIFAHDEIILDLPVDRFDRIPAAELEEFYGEASRQYELQYRTYMSTKETKADGQRINEDLSPDFFRGLFPSHSQLDQQESQAPFAVKGRFQFSSSLQTPLPISRLHPSIMGTAAYLPFLECNHGVASLHHPIEKGTLSVLESPGIVMESIFDGGVGYTEKDWGVNFPSTWIWAQTNIFKKSPGSSLLISVASVPVLGPDFSDWVSTHLPMFSSLTNVPGMLLIYYHASTKTLYNFSSYILSAQLRDLKVTMNLENRSQTVSFLALTKDPHNIQEQIALQVEVTREMGTGVPLRAPSRAQGRMATAVEETIIAQTKMKLYRVRSGEILVEDQGLGSGLEIVGDIEWLQQKTSSRQT
ncbi:hypothetical protein BGZ83_006805 [Gryganskiella cystojenkinii]|nr:hypothetical protein BGZ83_006805 [Gryganskiella cystojenkinii]